MIEANHAKHTAGFDYQNNMYVFCKMEILSRTDARWNCARNFIRRFNRRDHVLQVHPLK